MGTPPDRVFNAADMYAFFCNLLLLRDEIHFRFSLVSKTQRA